MVVAAPNQLVPADAGTQPLRDQKSVRFGKGWIPASAGMSGSGNSFASDDNDATRVV
jgi:hypothetical protein